MQTLFIILLLDLIFIYSSIFDMQMLQQNSYNENNHYQHFIHNNINQNRSIYLIKFIFSLCLLLNQNINIYLYLFTIFILLIILISSYCNYQKYNDKLPLKFTKRIIRISLLEYGIYIILQLISVNKRLNLLYGLSLLYITINPYVLLLIIIILKPVEKMIFNHYKKIALEKLNKMNNLHIIGITGSFGKTSTKMILDSILRTTYKGFYTPASFNTPNGLLITINNEKSIFNDYFISEMGAKNVGEIKELCDIVHPKFGILTKIGNAHLESFKSIDNICKTKFELIESLPSDGLAVLNKDDEYQRKYELKNNCKVIWIGIENNADIMAKDIKMNQNGTTFTISFANEKENIKVSTILLGKKNVYNILSAVALAKNINVPNSKIGQGIKNIKPINHRLEIKKLNNLTIIDDSFNSNPEGAKSALEVISLMDGNKYIITPGMVEMGAMQEKLNHEFGKQIAGVCDKVYLVGPKQTKPIYEGLISNNYSEDKITICKSFKDAYNEVLNESKSKKITVLIENDLPDSYKEG